MLLSGCTDKILSSSNLSESVFTMIPGEVAAEIFARLDLSQKKISRLVCHEWRTIIDEYLLDFHVELTKETFPYFQNTSLPFKSVTITDELTDEDLFPARVHPDDKQSRWRFNANQLRFAPSTKPVVVPFSHSWKKLIPALPSISPHQMFYLLSNCEGIKHLIFAKKSLAMIDELPKVRMRGFQGLELLQSLEITFSFDPTWKEKQIFDQVIKIPTPGLKHLSIELRISLCPMEEAFPFYTMLFSAIISKKTSLKSLTLLFDVLVFPTNKNGYGAVPREEFAPESEMLWEDLEDISLDEMKLSFCSQEAQVPFDLGTKLLKNQKMLKTLDITLLNGCDHLIPLIEESIRNNAISLTSFSLQNGSYPGKILPAQILPTLSSCKELKALKLTGFKIEPGQSGAGRSLRCLKNLWRLELSGALHPSLLAEICTLEELEFFKFRYNMSVDAGHYDQLEENLLILTRSVSRLKEIKLLVGGLVLDFLLDVPGVQISGNRNGLHECTVRRFRIL